MAVTQTIWGLDLGRCALKAMKLRLASEGKIEILAYDYIEHAKVLSQPDADRNALIATALEKFLSRNDLSRDLAVVGVPGQHTLARFTKLPPVAPKRIPDIVRYEADQQIPFDMDEVIWDYQTFQQEGEPDIEVGIFAMKRELIREHLLHFEQASIEPVAVQSGPLAVYNAAKFEGFLTDETTILLDIGAENSDLIIATPHSFWTRTVSIGGNNFTEALVKSFKLSFSKGENLKRTASTSKYARQIFQAMRPVFADLVQELQRSMGFYSSTHRDTKIEKIICVGNAARLPGLQKYLQQNLGLTVERPETFLKAVFVGEAVKDEPKAEFLSFAVAYGLALQGLDVASVTSNLLPAEIAKHIVWKKKRPSFAAAAACLLIAGGLIWFRQSGDMSALAAGGEGSRPAPANVEEARSVIENGPGASLRDRAKAKAILAACRLMERELSTLEPQGGTERSQTEALIALQGNKTLIPRIVQTIHRSVPVLSGPLGQASSQSEILAAIAGGPPRHERRQILIEKVDIWFQPDLNEVVWESRVTVPEPINNPDEVLPGIKIEIKGRTPHKEGVNFVNDTFMNALRENGRQANMGFYFDRVYLWDGARVTPKTMSSSLPTFSSPGGRGFGLSTSPGGLPSANEAAALTASAKDLDPVTNELILEDWKFTIWVDAILEDYPEEEEANEDGE